MHTANLKNLISACILFSFMVSTASGDIIVVNPGESIQAAIDDANDGDEIEVAAGTYYEAINFNGKAVRLYSSGGPEVTTIDANGLNSSVVTCISGEDANTVLEGFIITYGNTAYGGGMYNNQSSPTVTNCIFSGNTAGSSGGGMYNDNNSSPNVTSCTFENNQAQEVSTNYGGGGMCNSNSNPVVTDCNFSGNSAGKWGGGMYNDSSSPVVTNCAFNSNTAYTGAGMFNQTSGPMLSMCTFNGNSAGGSGGGMYNYTTSSPTVTNCTFSDNSSAYCGGGMCNDGSSPTVTNCTFTGNTATTNGGGMYNYTNSYPTVTNCILWGDTPDEIFNDGTSSSTVTYSDVEGGYSGTGNINYDPRFVDAGANDFRLMSNSPCVDAGNTGAVPPDIPDLDGDGDTSEPIPFDLDLNPRVWNGVVDMGAFEYGELRVHNVTQNTSYIGIQKAIDDANDGDEIEVAPGTYKEETIDFKGKGIRLYSTDGPNDTIIDGTGNYHVVQCVSGEDASTILEGFTITGGNANGSSAHDSGGGMYNYNSSPTVTNCTFSNNSAEDDGGGIFNDAYNVVCNPTVINCRFYGNYAADKGGGIYNDYSKNLNVANCTFSGNSAETGGGAMFNYKSNPAVTKCNFSGNSAAGKGGAIYNDYSDNPKVANCTFSLNTADNAGGMYNYLSSPTVANCIFDRNSATGKGGAIYNDYNNQLKNTNVANCTFIENTAGDAGGMYNYKSSPTVRDCTFTSNSVTNQGGGIYNDYSPSPYVADCTFSGNTAEIHGGGMFNYSSCPTATNCTFTDNTATNEDGGGILNRYSDTTVTNCRFYNNSAGDRGGGIYNDYSDNPKVSNSTFINNRAWDDGGGMFNYKSSPTVANCIFCYNIATEYGGGMHNDYSDNPKVINCTFFYNHTGLYGGGISNYSDSKKVTTVTNCILWSNFAPIGSQIYNGSMSSTDISYSDVSGGYSGQGNINDDPLFVNAAGGDLRLLTFASPCVDAGDNNTPALPATDLAGNPRVMDGNGDGDSIVDMGAYELPFGVHNITRAIRYGYIQVAIDRALHGDEIEVGPGAYYEAIDFKGKAIRLYSSGGPEATTIDATGLSSSVVNCTSGEDANTILEGFTITGGNATNGGGMYNSSSSPTVIGCNFTDNTATLNGGGMYNQHSSSPTVTDCTFSGNFAAANGGGMCNWDNSSPTVNNCTFSGNFADANGGGMCNYNSSPTVSNCILWKDAPDEINDVNSSSVVTYSDVQGGWAGEGNIDAYPVLGVYGLAAMSLARWSPCIDAGNNDVVEGIAIDITGRPRLVDGDCDGTVTVDMGARELQHTYMGDFDSSCMVNMADFAFLAWVWLSSPLSENWDPVCDIGIPADGSIDNRDLKVLAENWLGSADTTITCDAGMLHHVFGLDAANAIYILKESCGITDSFYLEQMLYDAGYPPEEYIEYTAVESVRKFAPVLYFDRAHKGLPMSAQVYFETMMSPSLDDPSPDEIKWIPDWDPWDGPCGKPGVISVPGREESNCGMQNDEFLTLENGQIPTYYKVISDIDSEVDTGAKGRLRIAYWWFYGFQRYCNSFPLTDPGEHHGDWEHIIVTTDPNRTRADSVTYSFHGNWYTRQWGGFTTWGDRPVVYVGKVAHGCYHGQGNQGFGDDGISLWPWYCCEYADWRDPSENSKWYNANENLVSLRGSEPWMLADRIGSHYEFQGRKYTISHWRWGPHISYCDDWLTECINWTHVDACGTHPTSSALDWNIASCDGVGCGASECGGLPYFTGAYYDQGWPWGGGFASTADEYATPATSGAMASCGRCGHSRFGALVRLGDYWLITP